MSFFFVFFYPACLWLPFYGRKGETILGQPNQIHPLGVTQIPFAIFVDYVQGLADSTFRLDAVITPGSVRSPILIYNFFLFFFCLCIPTGLMRIIYCDIIAIISPTNLLNFCAETPSRNTFSICQRKSLARETHIHLYR